MYSSSTACLARLALQPPKPFIVHTAGKANLPQLRTEVDVQPEELLRAFEQMHTIRRMEALSDQCYKQKKIRGFCHLYTGQEAIATGVVNSLHPKDAIVTGYRDHGWFALRGGSPYQVFCEMFGKKDGCSKGKGGSMHMYNAERGFFGGNGIVGAQVPLGAGLAWKYSYANAEKPENVSMALYGDGAANQGQIFEAFNFSALQRLPVIYACENNQFGMGTSKKRGSAQPEFYRRCEYIPGLFVDGMDFLAVREAVRWAREWCTGGNGPAILEFDSYRYVGHSMSDPDTAYRSQDDVKEVKVGRDCIERLRRLILTSKFASEDELKKIEKDAKKAVDEQLVKAEAAASTPIEELYTDIVTGEQFPIRTCQGTVNASASA